MKYWSECKSDRYMYKHLLQILELYKKLKLKSYKFILLSCNYSNMQYVEFQNEV